MIFPESVKKYLNLQTNGETWLYDEMPEMKHALGLDLFGRKRVLELGAGIGRGSVWLNHSGLISDAEYYLLDGDKGDVRYKGIRENGGEFYNAHESTRAYCDANGMKHYSVIDSVEGLKDIDFVCSFLSRGFHWPLSLYLGKIEDILATGCLLLFGIRGLDKKQWIDDQLDFVCQYYNVVRLVFEPRSSRHSILVLEKK